MPQTGGQGVVMAFEDPATLAYVLSRCTKPDSLKQTEPQLSHAEHLKKRENHRMARIEKSMPLQQEE